MYLTDDDKWRAITTRDPQADGVFVYAVRTTRIYCRPNCKARLARRANVRFYKDCRAAEAGGFRACKRCKPLTQGGMPEDEAVARIRELVARAEAGGSGELSSIRSIHGETKNSPSLLASQARVSRWHFHRKFKEVTGLTPREYLKQRERQRREAGTTTAAATAEVPAESSSGPTTATTTTPSASTDSDLFDFALGDDALLPDLSLLLAETEGGSLSATSDQPFPTFNDCFPADLNLSGYNFEGLEPVFLDPALWAGAAAGEFMDGRMFAQEGEMVAAATTTTTGTTTIPSTADNIFDAGGQET
ncbi:hypothetical protein SBRCBS47491_001914 [Sporothrix bragantina]|uniref:HTH araC/xylS-type domain-containing protein n=1 Tax=Sporothrix bragantina TaxID=671064 RepID=A0ABP0B2J6_9PEZI